MKPFRK